MTQVAAGPEGAVAPLAPARRARDSRPVHRGVARLAFATLAHATLAIAATACGGAGPSDLADAPIACVRPIGALDGPLEVRPVIDAPVRPLQDGDDVTLRFGVQGGFMLLVGLEAQNVDGCATYLSVGLRDPDTGQLAATESRPSPLVEGADGWGTLMAPVTSSLANLSLCPPSASRPIVDTPWTLELSLLAGPGRTATTSLTVVPRCAVDDVMCRDYCVRSAGAR